MKHREAWIARSRYLTCIYEGKVKQHGKSRLYFTTMNGESDDANCIIGQVLVYELCRAFTYEGVTGIVWSSYTYYNMGNNHLY